MGPLMGCRIVCKGFGEGSVKAPKSLFYFFLWDALFWPASRWGSSVNLTVQTLGDNVFTGNITGQVVPKLCLGNFLFWVTIQSQVQRFNPADQKPLFPQLHPPFSQGWNKFLLPFALVGAASPGQ